MNAYGSSKLQLITKYVQSATKCNETNDNNVRLGRFSNESNGGEQEKFSDNELETNSMLSKSKRIDA